MYNLSLGILKDFEKYLDSLDISSSTSRFYKSDVRQFLDWLVKYDYQNIDKYVVNEYIAFLRGRNTPKRTLNRKLSSLRKLSEFLKKDFMKNFSNEKVSRTNFITKNGKAVASAALLLILAASLSSSKTQAVNLVNPLETKSRVNVEQIADKTDLTAPAQIKSGEKVTIILDQPDSTSAESLDKLPLILGASANKESLREDKIYESAGKAVIYKGNTNTKVVNPLVSDKSAIFITPTSDTGNQSLFVDSQGEGYFIVALQKAAIDDISFNWLISN